MLSASFTIVIFPKQNPKILTYNTHMELWLVNKSGSNQYQIYYEALKNGCLVEGFGSVFHGLD
jgi:hypothetical protein